MQFDGMITILCEEKHYSEKRIHLRIYADFFVQTSLFRDE